MQQLQLPKPDLIIVDEVHKANGGFPDAVFRFLERFRSVFALGLTATLGSGDGNTETALGPRRAFAASSSHPSPELRQCRCLPRGAL